MKPENIATLEKHRHFHDTLIKAFYLKGLNYMEREDMLRVYREEWAPMANPDLWCGECLAEFVKDVYKRFDEYLKSIIVISTEPAQEIKADGVIVPPQDVEVKIIDTTEPQKVLPPPIINTNTQHVKANFPKHKRR